MGETIFRYLLRRGRWSRAASKYVVIFRWRCPVAIGLRFTVEADWWELNVVCRGNWWFGFWWRGRRNWGLVRHWINRHLFEVQIRFYYDTPSAHTYPFLVENGDIFLWFRVLSTRLRWKRSPKTHLFKNALQRGNFWKRLLLVYMCMDENEGFRIRWSHTSYIHRILPALRMGAERDAIYFHRFSVFVWTGENDSNTLSVDAYFWENGEEKCPF